jgi:putative MATE family efflux protein
MANTFEIIGKLSISLLIIISIILTILGLIFEEPILKAFGADGQVLEYAKQFITIIIFGIILQNLSFGMNNLIRAQGSPMTAMMTMLIGAILNTILNPIFIFGFHLGIRGSALATIISQAVRAIWVQSYFFGKRSMLKIKKENLGLKKDVILGIFAIGVSPFLMQIAASVITIMFNKSLKTYGGDIAIAAFGIINSIAMLILMPIFGINQGAQPIIGFNYGAQKYARVKHTLKLAIFAATCVTTFGFIMVELFPTAILSVFTNDTELIDIGANGLRIFLMMLPIVAFQIVSSNYFQAVGKPKHSMFLSLSRQVIVLIPLILILPGIFRLNGVWAAGPASDFISSVITAIFLYFEIKHLNMKHNEGTV